MTAKTTEVLICGAGPTGLTLACELRRLGVPAILVERQTAGANTSRAAVVQARTLEVLEPLGVTDRLLARGVQVPIFTVRDRDRVLATISFRELPTNYPFTLMCPQDQTEAILEQRLHELGAEVLRPVELLDFSETAEQVEVTLQADDHTLSTVKARWLVGCDGAHSIVRRKSGIEFAGGAYDEAFLLADVEMNWPLGREEVCLFFSPAGLVVVAPLPHDHFRIVATVESSENEPTLENMQAILDERGPEGQIARVKRLVWSSRFQIQHRVAHQLRKNRILLAGDAGHVHSPAGGQGMNTGIQDAVALAGALRAVHQNNDAPLIAWEHARLKIARGVVSITDRITRAATLTSPAGVAIRNAVISFLGHADFVSTAVAEQLAELER